MASPIIRSLTPAATTLQVGQSTTVTFDAYDPDGRTVTFTGTATDTAGNIAQQTTTVTWSDPISYTLTTTDTGVTIVQDPVNPARFTVTAAG